MNKKNTSNPTKDPVETLRENTLLLARGITKTFTQGGNKLNVLNNLDLKILCGNRIKSAVFEYKDATPYLDKIFKNVRRYKRKYKRYSQIASEAGAYTSRISDMEKMYSKCKTIKDELQ